MNRIGNFHKRELRRVTLNNGIKCCFINDMNQEETAFRVSVGGGQESDPTDYCGLSLLCTQLLFAGSKRYSGVQNFKQFITDNEIPCYAIQDIVETSFAAFSPEFALNDLLHRISDAFKNPELTAEGLEYMVERYRSGFFKTMQDDGLRYRQISLNVVTKDTVLGKKIEWLTDNKRALLALQEYYDRYFKPDNMTVVIVSNLPVSEQYDHVRKSLGLLDGIFEYPDYTRSIDWKITGRNDELLLTKAFTMNPTRILSVEFHLPNDTSISSSLYLGYLFVKSDSGSLNYYLKSEGLITGIEAKHFLYKKEFQSLQILLHQTEDGDEKIDKLLSAVLGYMALVKSLTPSKILFDQSRQYFLNLRINENLSDLMDKCSAVFSLSKQFELSPNDDDLLFPEVPRCFDPANIRKTAEALSLSNCAVTILSDKYVNTPMHRGTEHYLQYSTEYVKIKPCFDNISLPRPSRIFGLNEIFPIHTSETELRLLNPDLCVKTIASATRAQLTMKIQSRDFAFFPLSVKQLYTNILDYKMWLLSDESTFKTTIRAEDSSIIVDINSIPAALPQVLATIIEFLETPIENEYLKIKERELKKYENLMCGNDSPDLNLYTEQFIEKNNNVQSMMDALQKVNSKDDLPYGIKGKVTLLLGGSVNEGLTLKVHRLAKKLSSSDSVLSIPFCPEPAQIAKCKVEQVRALTEPMTTRTKKNHSVCLKNLDVGAFSYSNWCQATLLAEILNTLIPSEIRIRTTPLATFTAKATLSCGRIGIFMKALHRISAHALVRTLNDCVLECLEDLLDCSCDNILINAKARCANVLLTMKENLQCEMARICAPINYDLPVMEYWSLFPKYLWETSPSDVVDLCARLIAENVVHNAPTCLFLSEPDTVIPSELLWNMVMPLFGLYKPIATFGQYPTMRTSQNYNLHSKRTHYTDANEEQTRSALQLEEAFVTANSLATLAKMYIE